MRPSPGDPVDLALGVGPGDLGVSTEIYEARRAEMTAKYGLDESIPVQYINWLKRLAAFDLGESIFTGLPVKDELAAKLPATLALSLTAIAIEALIAFTGGCLSAVKARGAADNIIRIFCVAIASLPAFVISLLLLLLFAVKLHVYDISSSASFGRLWLPAIILGVSCSPQPLRMVRAAMLSELGHTYISADKSRGLPAMMMIFDAIRNALLPILTTIALSFANLIGGAVVIESIFSWPGLGDYAMKGIQNHDYPAVQGYTLLTVSSVIAINLLVEMAYVFADPHAKKKERGSSQNAYD